MPYQSFPYNAPSTWREFLARIAAIAVAALLVLGGFQLIQTFGDRKPHTGAMHLDDATPRALPSNGGEPEAEPLPTSQSERVR